MYALKLKGLDNYDKEMLDNYWNRFNEDESFSDILGISISTTNKCNLRCVYCYAGKSRESDAIDYSNELTLEGQKSIIEQGCELGAKTLIICGDGEPTSDKNLIAIVEYANSKKMTSIVVTNATMFGNDEQAKEVHSMTGKELLKKLYDANASLIVKMESVNKENYEFIVGVKDTYDSFLKAVKRIKECGFCDSNEQGVTRLAFSSVIMKNNFNELEQLKKFADDHNAQYICKLPSLVGNALENLENMFEIKKYEEIRSNLFKYTAKRETLMVDTPRCMAWHYGPCIGVDGEIRECYTSPYSLENRVGNIKENSLKELVMQKKKRCNLNCGDFCPVKTRINDELTEKGIDKIWTLNKDKSKLLGY